MSFYTAKYVRELLELLPDDEPVFGCLSFRQDQEVEYRKDDGLVYARTPTPEEWEAIVNKAESMADAAGDYGPWASMWECLNDAKGEVCPYPEEPEDEHECDHGPTMHENYWPHCNGECEVCGGED